MFCGNVYLLCPPSQEVNAQRAIASLSKAMLEMDTVAIARFVQRKNGTPKFVCLTPGYFLTQDLFILIFCFYL